MTWLHMSRKSFVPRCTSSYIMHSTPLYDCSSSSAFVEDRSRTACARAPMCRSEYIHISSLDPRRGPPTGRGPRSPQNSPHSPGTVAAAPRTPVPAHRQIVRIKFHQSREVGETRREEGGDTLRALHVRRHHDPRKKFDAQRRVLLSVPSRRCVRLPRHVRWGVVGHASDVVAARHTDGGEENSTRPASGGRTDDLRRCTIPLLKNKELVGVGRRGVKINVVKRGQCIFIF